MRRVVPVRLATYIATSACWSSESGSFPCSGANARPMLAARRRARRAPRSALRAGARSGRTARRVVRVGDVCSSYNDELVAAEPRHAQHVRDRRQAVRHGAQHLVTTTMPERVVDLFEPVEIEQHERDELIVGRLVEQCLQLGAEQSPVRQPGQRVVVARKAFSAACRRSRRTPATSRNKPRYNTARPMASAR